ncbi:MAG: hypothetical protein GQ574_16045 [Crocinitomix sp.]|nr:hypothetical protein [Crocinitomix sp.]
MAIGLFAGANSTIVTYAFVSTRDGKVIGAEIVRKQRFMYTAMGHWPGTVNIKKENLFYKNNVDSCLLVEDEYGKIVDYYCPIFDQVWKIRFFEHPTQYDLYGWGHGKYKPSQKQLEYLFKEYGIRNLLTDYIYGDNLFKLLRDIRKTEWIVNYSSLAKDTLVQGP